MKKTISLITGGSAAGVLFFLIILFVPIIVVLDIFSSSGGIFGGNGSSSVTKKKECGFTISATSLSKSEYKEKLEDYSKNSNSNFDIFAKNADKIYEYANSKQVNPELVAVRAYVEGHGKTTGTYNYWGMGCTNKGGLAACFNYSSFEEGYTDYINNISKYDSLADMMSKYAYIGEYWYNPGSSSIGGCYYAKYIYTEELMPVRVKNACSSSAPSCSISNTANCTKTTAEDQEAYATWQVEQSMAKARKTIFDLEFEEGPCSYSAGSIQHLSNYNLNANGLEKLDRTLTSTEIADLNAYIKQEVDNAGYGTGAGVAAAGQALTYWLEQKGYYLQYRWGGGHYNEADAYGTFIGVNSNWGSDDFGCDHGGRCYWGMDCSGFYSWTVRNACKNEFNILGSWPLTNNYGPVISAEESKPGDVMVWKEQHIMLVVKNNGDGTVIVAESRGKDGLVFTKQGPGVKNFEKYKFVDMSTYYQKNCQTTRTT